MRFTILAMHHTSMSNLRHNGVQALEGLLADAEQLAGSVHSTAELSERVSKVRLHCKILRLLV